MIGSRVAHRSAVLQSRRSQLAAGKRASRGKVGYIGSQMALIVLNNGDTLPVDWNAHWDTGALIVNGNNLTIDHYLINGSVIFQGSNPTMTNCKIYANAEAFFGVTLSSGGHGVLTITDTTVVGNSSAGITQGNGISSDSGLVARRCDVSNTGDGIHILAQVDPAQAIVSQCYVHDQAFIDEAQHCDGIQVFNNTVSASTFTIEHNYVARTVSTIGTPMNSALTCGQPTNDDFPRARAIINNNYFQSGLYHLRVNFRVYNNDITNNDLGPIYASEFGIIGVETPRMVNTWSGNRDSTGATIANPHIQTTPIIKQALQTTNGTTTAQVLTTDAGLTAQGDTLLVVYATDNNTASDPTSNAGVPVQIGTSRTDGNGNGQLRAYLVPVANAGSKTVTIPAAGGFDVMGAVFVVDGDVLSEGFNSAAVTSSSTNHAAPATSFSGSADLQVVLAFIMQNATIDITPSGLTQQANPQCLPFSALAVGTVNRTSSGVTPSYAFTTSGAAKPGMIVFGLQS